jgi:hypothetical protein|nr:MAG TPA: hypothetical protein [Caudoviricetes sp.]
MEEKYWGLCETCIHSVDTGPTIECGLNLLYCNNHYEPMEEMNDESKDKGTEEDIIPF